MDEPAVSAVAALDEPTRRRLYDHVVRAPAPVCRDEVAAATGIPRPTVAFHLDKLVAERLLEVTYQRRTGRSGPGAGRPAKLYRRSARQITVTVPERHYDLAGHLLASALEEADRHGTPPRPVLARTAHRAGRDLAARTCGGVTAALEQHGFEPRADGADVLLGNCPFQRLAQDHPTLVCEMTLHLVAGLAAGDPGWQARLDPGPNRCCVRLTAR